MKKIIVSLCVVTFLFASCQKDLFDGPGCCCHKKHEKGKHHMKHDKDMPVESQTGASSGSTQSTGVQ